MNTRFLKFVLPVAMLTLLAAFLLTAPVHAQDATPTDPAPVVVATDVSVSPTPAPDIIPTDPAPIAAPTDALVDGVTAPDATPTEAVLFDNPTDNPQPQVVGTGGITTVIDGLSDAGLTLVDNNNNPLPLVSEQAGEALLDVDPWFVVGATTYSFTLADCNPDIAGNQGCLNPLQAAVDYISVNGKVPSDGFIHVDAGTLPNQKVTIDGGLPFLNSLKGIIGHVNQDTLAPDAILSFTDGTSGSYIFVHNKLNGLTLSGLSIKGDITALITQWGVVDIINSQGAILLQDLVVENGYTGGSGIRINNHDGSITIKNVDSSRNSGGGAYIQNLVSAAGVSITNSSFNDNNAGTSVFLNTGIHIITKGVVFITGVTASRNTGTDPNLWIEQAGSVMIKNSSFNGNNSSPGMDIQGINGAITLLNVHADENYSGLILSSNSSISLTGVSASNNTDFGARLDTCWGSPCTTSGTGKVTISSSTFDSNTASSGGVDNSGLWVHARGAISLTGVSASSNGMVGFDATGAILKNQDSLLVNPVTINTSTFNTNQYQGLAVNSKGAINLTSVSASDNIRNIGALLDNSFGTTPGVTIKGTTLAINSFISNGNSLGDYGLQILSNGNVSLSYVAAGSNAGMGLSFSTSLPSNVTITNSSFGDNDYHGLNISTLGTISLTDVYADFNGYKGAILNNDGALTPKSVTIKNSEFSYNNDHSLVINSKGAITLTNTNASSNGSFNYGVIATNSTGTAGVTITGGNFNNNFTGINISTRGPIKLGNVIANQNQRGADLANETAVTAQAVTIINGVFSGNTNRGLYVITTGALNLTNIIADDNTGYGAFLDQRPASSAFPTATITIGEFYNNDNYGLVLYGRGTIKLTNINASRNIGNGAYIENHSGNVSLLASGVHGVNLFNSNTGTHDGLDINTQGTVTLMKVYASANSGATGAYLFYTTDFITYFPVGNVIINGGLFSNQVRGLVVLSKGSINVNDVRAFQNTNTGISLDNTYDFTGTKGITITRTSVDQNAAGLSAVSYGTILVNKIKATENTGQGVSLNNAFGAFTTPKGISVLGSYGTSEISTNGAQGLYIRTKGAVVISKLNANNNTGFAVDVNNYQVGLGKGTVTLSSITTNNNTQRAINIESNNTVSLSSLTVLYNGLSLGGSRGIGINTHNHNLSLSKSLISGNGFYGMAATIGTGIFAISNTFYFGNSVFSPGIYENILITH
jgi:hypothetical protein